MRNTRPHRRQALLLLTTAILSGPAAIAGTQLSIQVYKDPSCGCCGAWVDKLRQAGFAVSVSETTDMDAVKTRLGVPLDLQSCHTGVIQGHAVEGHVPPTDIRTYLSKNPKSAGIAVPGMPSGSPGMESADGSTDPYTVWEFYSGGKRRAFAHHA